DLGAVHLQQDAAQVLGRVAVVDPLERDDEPSESADGVRAGLLDTQGLRHGAGLWRTAGLRHGAPSGGRRVGAQHRPGGEPLLRLIGADVHAHLAADTVRPDDLPDDEQHQYVSMISTRTPRPPIDVTTWRSALA